MMDRAGDTVGQAAETTREAAGTMSATVRQNPIPYALIGIGVAWLVASNRSSRSYGYQHSHNHTWGDGESGIGTSTGYYGNSEYAAAGAFHPELGSRPGRARVGEVAHEVGERMSEMASEASEQARRAAEQAQRAAYQARGQWQSMLNNNPMALGVAALAAGALVGAALPVTRVENEYMGEMRDSVVESAREMAHDAAESAREIRDEAAERLTSALGGESGSGSGGDAEASGSTGTSPSATSSPETKSGRSRKSS